MLCGCCVCAESWNWFLGSLYRKTVSSLKSRSRARSREVVVTSCCCCFLRCCRGWQKISPSNTRESGNSFYCLPFGADDDGEESNCQTAKSSSSKRTQPDDGASFYQRDPLTEAAAATTTYIQATVLVTTDIEYTHTQRDGDAAAFA